MKKLISIPFLLFLTACGNDYKYHVYGSVNTSKGVKPAEWYADTLYYDADTIFYTNTDSSIVKIYPPYIVTKIK
jgi:hypothetical protein